MVREFLHNKWFKFGLWTALYLAWVIWLGNYWWLLGIAVIFDVYISKKVRWCFWKPKDKKKKNAVVEWVDAIIFALVVATFIRMFFIEAYVIPSSSMEKSLMTGDYLFVSKLTYGPKVSETPIAMPLVHNVMPVFGGESYSEIIKRPYKRLAGFSEIERNDIVVFGFPNGDTVLSMAPQADYYRMCRINGKRFAEQAYGPVIVRPRDRKDNYVKRCIAVAGDTLLIKDGNVYIDGVKSEPIEGMQNTFTVVTNGAQINSSLLDDMNINRSELAFDPYLPGYPALPLTEEDLEKVKKLPILVSIEKNIERYSETFPESLVDIFPFDKNYKWTRDNYGPLWIPEKGATVKLTLENLPLYSRIIRVYEGNDLKVNGREIIINGQVADTYTFAQDYYFMMGDNRHNSADSRYWGFVPEDHVVGKPLLVWFSSNKNKSFPGNIRWSRIFKLV